jgi:hypothetical protein
MVQNDVAFSDEELNLLLSEIENQEETREISPLEALIFRAKEFSHTEEKKLKQRLFGKIKTLKLKNLFLTALLCLFFFISGFAIGWTVKKQTLLPLNTLEEKILLLIEDIRQRYERCEMELGPETLPSVNSSHSSEEIIEPLFSNQDFSIA